MIRRSSNQIYKIASGEGEYKSYKRLLTSEAFTSTAVNEALLVHASQKGETMKRIYVPMDESEIRKPTTYRSEDMMKVRDLAGGLVNGYRTINTIGVSEDGRHITLLETKPFSSTEKRFVSENIFKQEIIEETTTALRKGNPDLEIIYLLDRGFDDQKILNTIIEKKSDFIVRASHTDRTVMYQKKALRLDRVPLQTREVKQYQKLTINNRTYQDITLTLSTASIQMTGHRNSLVKAALTRRDGTLLFEKPFYLMTTCTMKPYAVFKCYMKRWKIEGVFQFLKDTIGWEEFRVRDLKSIKHIIALTYLVGAYFYEVGEGLISQEFIEFVAQLGRGKGKIGKKFLIQGLQDIIATVKVLKAFKGWQIKDIVKLYTELGYKEDAEEIFLNNKGGAA